MHMPPDNLTAIPHNYQARHLRLRREWVIEQRNLMDEGVHSIAVFRWKWLAQLVCWTFWSKSAQVVPFENR